MKKSIKKLCNKSIKSTKNVIGGNNGGGMYKDLVRANAMRINDRT